jgi:hypothetical protein
VHGHKRASRGDFAGSIKASRSACQPDS